VPTPETLRLLKFLKMIWLTPEFVTELFCPTPRSRENLNVNGAVGKILEQKLYKKNTKKINDFVWGFNIK
jgi:hypothetical protein